MVEDSGGTASKVTGTAAMLGGLAWLLLIPAAVLERIGLLDYDGYNRLLAGPLLLFLVALLMAPKALMVPGWSVRAGFCVAALGAGLLLTGNVVEFYGVLLQDKPNAYAASRAGVADHWVGSDIGWVVFGFGMLLLLVGGLTAAVALQRHRMRPLWVIVFIATLGVGVLAANLFALQSVLVSFPVLALYAAGWIGFGLLTFRRGISGPASGFGARRRRSPFQG